MPLLSSFVTVPFCLSNIVYISSYLSLSLYLLIFQSHVFKRLQGVALLSVFINIDVDIHCKLKHTLDCVVEILCNF